MKKSKTKKRLLFEIQIPTKEKEIEELLGSSEYVWLYQQKIDDMLKYAKGEDGDIWEIEELEMDTKAGQYDIALDWVERNIEDQYRYDMESMKEVRAKVAAELKGEQRK